ncbi:hypothetical protein OUZ56_029683 [Daphnia magna]|uniref:Secreted protein n=1 Tax=Daphnia magna TaxID=35525 RepID=A0ABR0B7Z3_9CRUS|nr:hypothetical protein OUZ56_029683 [Daphnia magna]
MILLPKGYWLLLLLGFVSPVLYFSSLFRSAFPQRSTARPRPPLGCTPDLEYPPTTPCHEPSSSVSDSLPAPYVLLSYHLLPAILTPLVSCRTLRLTVHFSASCRKLRLTVHFSASCRKLRLTVHCPILAKRFGSRFTSLILAEHFGSRSLPRFLPNSSAHGSLPRFLPTTSAHGFHYPRSLNVPVCTALTLFTIFPPGVSPSLCFPRLTYGRSPDPIPQQFKLGRRLSGVPDSHHRRNTGSNRNTTTKETYRRFCISTM